MHAIGGDGGDRLPLVGQNLQPIAAAIDRLTEALDELAKVAATDLLVDDQGVANYAYQQIVVAMRLLSTVGS